jgi:hypothetical protein
MDIKKIEEEIKSGKNTITVGEVVRIPASIRPELIRYCQENKVDARNVIIVLIENFLEEIDKCRKSKNKTIPY